MLRTLPYLLWLTLSLNKKLFRIPIQSRNLAHRLQMNPLRTARIAEGRTWGDGPVTYSDSSMWFRALLVLGGSIGLLSLLLETHRPDLPRISTDFGFYLQWGI